MKRIYIKYTFLLSLAVGCTYLGYGIIHKISHKKQVSDRVAQLPSFEFSDLNGGMYSHKQLRGKAAWLVYFDSGCEFCQMEIKDLQKNSTLLDDLEVVLISAEDSTTLQKFGQVYSFDKHENFHIVQDQTHQCYQRFGMVSTPSSLLYDAQGTLIQRFNGVIKVEKIHTLFKQQARP